MVFVSNSRRATYSARRRSRTAASGYSCASRRSRPARGFVAQVLVERDARRRRKPRQVILAERNRQVAALRDRDRVGERLRQVGELLRHLGLRREVLLRREAARPARIGEHVTLGDAHARLVRAEIARAQELHRMRRDDRQRRSRSASATVAARARRRRRGPRAAPRGSSAAETAPPIGGRALRRRGVALQQRLADVAVARAGQRDQAVGAFVEPLAAKLGAAAMLVACDRRATASRTSAGSPRASRRAAARARAVALAVVRDPHVAADDRLDAARARRLVELDEAELVGEIGERERRHAVGRRRGDGVVDAHRAVDDRVFAVQAQVDEAGS